VRVGKIDLPAVHLCLCLNESFSCVRENNDNSVCRWLNDEVVNAYFWLLREKLVEEKFPRKFDIILSYFYSALTGDAKKQKNPDGYMKSLLDMFTSRNIAVCCYLVPMIAIVD
jgi:Ulp1 family protease